MKKMKRKALTRRQCRGVMASVMRIPMKTSTAWTMWMMVMMTMVIGMTPMKVGLIVRKLPVAVAVMVIPGETRMMVMMMMITRLRMMMPQVDDANEENDDNDEGDDEDD